MMNSTVRRTLVGLAMVGLVSFLAAPALMAQPAAAGNPKCGSVVGLMHHSLSNLGTSPIGRNFVSIQRVSPIHANPSNPSFNGFSRLCARMGMPQGVPTDIDGDAQPDNASLTQYNPIAGTVNTVRCQSGLPSVSWDPGAGVEIVPELSNSAAVSMIVPGVECSERYAVYEKGSGATGIQYFPIPLSTTCSDRNCLCSQLNLPDGTQIQMIKASSPAIVENFLCDSVNPPVDVFRVPLPIGEAARIETTGSTPGASAGAPVNCISGVPCAATPSNDYPQPLVY